MKFSKRHSSKTYNYAYALAIGYAVVMSFFINNAITSGEKLSWGFTHSEPYTPHNIVLPLLLFYVARILVLFLPALLGKMKIAWNWMVGGLVGAALPEFVLFLTLLNLTKKTVSSCDPNEFGCGWGSLMIVILLFSSCFLQIVGMLVGLKIAKEGK